MKNREYCGFVISLFICIICIFCAHNEFANDRLFECGLFGFAAIVNGCAAVMEWIDNGNKRL